MPDRGHELTDAELKKLERRIAREYKTAVKDMQVKLDKYLRQTEKQRQVQEALYKAGKITKEEYEGWCYRHTMMGKRWEQMRDVLASDMTHANQVALGITKGKMPDIFALNANYATFQIEQSGRIDTGFTLYNHDTAAYLLGDQRQLMPKPSAKKAREIAANKDMQWNMKKIQSAVLQGVLQGEPPEAVARRLMDVGQMNYNSAVRYARTMTTSAQNAGRYEAFHRAKRLGVDLTIEWQATLDSRTRHEHRQMHGQRREVDEPFETPDGYTIMYPADCTGTSDAPQKEIWNCRCTLLAWVKGFERDTVKESPAMDGKTFEEWQNEKAPKPKPQEEKPYKTEQEYRQAQERAKAGYEPARRELDRQKEEEKEKLLDDYGGSFIEQKMEIRHNPDLSEEEKERLIDAIDEKREEYMQKCWDIDKAYVQRYADAYNESRSVFDLDYEYNRITGSPSVRDLVREVNPRFTDFDYGHTHNCQRCAVALETRMRGYDVRAMAADQYGGLGAAAKINDMFPYAEKVSIKYGGQEATNAVIEQMKQWGDGSRAIIGIDRRTGEGHVFNVINDKGNIIFIDAQADFMWWTEGVEPPIHGGAIMEAIQTDLVRTDNAKMFAVPDGWLEKL